MFILIDSGAPVNTIKVIKEMQIYEMRFTNKKFFLAVSFILLCSGLKFSVPIKKSYIKRTAKIIDIKKIPCEEDICFAARNSKRKLGNLIRILIMVFFAAEYVFFFSCAAVSSGEIFGMSAFLSSISSRIR